MQKSFAFLLLLGLVTVVAVESRSNQPQDEKQLRKIESRTGKCEQQNDVSMMSLFADDFVVSSKKVLSKQQVEEAVKNNRIAHGKAPSPYTIEKKTMQVYIFGDTSPTLRLPFRGTLFPGIPSMSLRIQPHQYRGQL